MADTIKRVFHFHANGHALSGLFTRPVSKTIEPQAPTVLPTIGRYGNARVENFRWGHYSHFKAGYSHVADRKYQKGDKEFYPTPVTAPPEGLNVPNSPTPPPPFPPPPPYYSPPHAVP